MKNLLLPLEEMAEELLSWDPVSGCLNINERSEAIELAMFWGQHAADTILLQGGWLFPQTVLDKGINLTMTRRMPVTHVYSDYAPEQREITLYLSSIEEGKQQLEQIIQARVSRESLWSIVAAHELFHHMECSQFGLVSRKKLVTVCDLGFYQIKRGIRALSEVAATTFVHTLIPDLMLFLVNGRSQGRVYYV